MFETDKQTPSIGLTRSPSPEPQMSITPVDMRQAQFSTTLRGFDKAAVTTYLESASEGFEQALRENERLRQEIGRMGAALSQFRELEGGIKNTLLTAQKVADDMRENALQESGRIVREAEGRAELLVQKARARVEDIERDINGMRLKRRETEVNLESVIAAVQSTLDFVRERDAREARAHGRGIADVA
jgi:cell division initiation protein